MAATGFRLPLRRFAGDERGNIAMLFAFFLVVGTMLGALAVDEGSLYLQRRRAQSAADLASIAAAADPAHAYLRARQALADAGLIGAADLDPAGRPVTLSVETGAYTPDPALPVAARFRAGGAVVNAARVRFTSEGGLYFAEGWGRVPTIGVQALASATPEVTFSVGSTLARLSGGVPNAVLDALLGADVELSAASYNGLLDARVGVFGFLDAMAQELHISAGTYDDVLAASADQGQIAASMASVLTGADATAATALGQSLGHNGTVPLGRLLDLGPAGGLDIGTGAASGYTASVSALQLLAASGAVSDGTHQMTLDLAAGVPGLTSLTLDLAVGEPQQFASWFALGPSGTIVRTAQVRLKFVATVGGGAGLGNVAIRVPLYLDLAYAEAGVESAACPANGGSNGSAVIDARPGVARLTLGEVSDGALGDFAGTPAIAPATLVNAALLRVTGSGVADVGQVNATPLNFSAADIAAGTVKRAVTTDFTRSLTSSLLSTMTLNVSVLGLGLVPTASIAPLLRAAIMPVAPVLDSTIAATLATLGLTLGTADVEVYDVRCGRAVLVG